VVVEEKKTASEVGAIVTVTYKDGTVQKLRVREISDATHTISWELESSAPAVPHSGAHHTIRLRRISDINGTFIEWTSDFARDASQEVIQDARFKQKEYFFAIAAAAEGKPLTSLSVTSTSSSSGGHAHPHKGEHKGESKEEKRTPSKKIIGGLGGVYNPTKAREGVVGIWEELQALQKACAESTTINVPSLSLLCARYRKLPITWQIDWKVADLSPEVAQKVADDVRAKLNAAKTRLGDNGKPLPRLFDAH